MIGHRLPPFPESTNTQLGNGIKWKRLADDFSNVEMPRYERLKQMSFEFCELDDLGKIPGTGYAKPLRISNRRRIEPSSIGDMWADHTNIIPDKIQVQIIIPSI